VNAFPNMDNNFNGYNGDKVSILTMLNIVGGQLTREHVYNHLILQNTNEGAK